MFENTLKDLEVVCGKVLQEMKQKKIGNIVKESEIDAFEHRKKKAESETLALEARLANVRAELDAEKQKALASIQEQDRKNQEREKALMDKANMLAERDYQVRMLEQDLKSQLDASYKAKLEADRLIVIYTAKLKKFEELTRA